MRKHTLLFLLVLIYWIRVDRKQRSLLLSVQLPRRHTEHSSNCNLKAPAGEIKQMLRVLLLLMKQLEVVQETGGLLASSLAPA